jgi:hypothetical protein
MSPVGRLFFEIGGDTSRLNASLQEAIKIAEEAGVKITRRRSKLHPVLRIGGCDF